MLSPEKIPWLKQARHSSRYLVGVSGGADSTALLCLLQAAGFRNLVVCHLNHGLRGRNSNADASFVKRLAHRMGYICTIDKADIRQRMAETSESMETASRRARHDFFARCASEHRCRTLLLAHHADDQAETVLWNLLRGSHGLKGMRESQEMQCAGRKLKIVRPLLGVRRDDLREWLAASGQKWRSDASNEHPVAIRNRIRNEVMPLLREITERDPVPQLVLGASDEIEREREDLIALESARLLDPQGRLHLGAMKLLPRYLQRLGFREFLAKHRIPNIGRSLLEQCLEMMNPANPASVNLPGGGRIRRREGRIWIEN